MDLYSSLASVSAAGGTNAWTITGTISLDGVGPGDMIIVGSRTFWGSSQKGFRIATIDRAAKTFTTTDNADTTYTGAAFFIRYTGSGINFLPGMLQTVLNRLDALFGIGSTIFAGGGTRFLLSRQSGTSALAELMFGIRSGDTTTGAFFLRQRQVSGVEVLDFISTTDGTTEVVVFRITRAGVVSFPSAFSTAALQAEGLNTGPLGGLRNLLLNGSMDIWPAATTGTAGYGPESWSMDSTTGWNRNADVPDARFRWSLEFASSSATSHSINQKLEAASARHLVGKNLRVSFWVKNVSGSAQMFAAISQANAENNFAGQTTIGFILVSASPSSSWTRYVVDFGVMPSGAANGLIFQIFRDSASAATTRITGAQMEIGPVVSNYEFVGERGGLSAEIVRCSRYFERFGGSNAAAFGVVTAFSSTVALGRLPYERKRAAPSLTFSAASTFRLLGDSTTYAATTVTVGDTPQPDSAVLQIEVASGLTPGKAYLLQRADGQSPTIDVSARL